MANLVDLPNAATLTGSETLPMQQGSGAVRATALRLVREVLSLAGNYGIGITAPDVPLHVRGSLKQQNASNGVDAIRLANADGTIGASFFTNGSTHTRLQSHISPLALRSVSSDIQFEIGSTVAGRWDASGNFLVSKSSAGLANQGCELSAAGIIYGTSSGAQALTLNRLGSTGTIAQFRQASVAVGSIDVTASNTSYNTSSDYRLWWKEGHTALTGSGDFIDALNPRYFPIVGHAGFVAHEFQQVSPSSVSGEKDAVDENNEPIYQGMQASSSDVMAHIIAELQSLRRRVAALEAAA